MKQSELKKIKLDRLVSLKGSCLCAGVQYRIEGMTRGVVNCFCSQCQKTSGHHVAATRVHQNDLSIDQDETLSWYESSPGCQRGFCNRCGGNLFWNRMSDDQISIMAGTLDKPTGLTTVESIYEKDANDYFKIPLL